MTARKKPGSDTLAYFWCAIGLMALAILISMLAPLLIASDSLEDNMLGLTTVGLISAGCWTGALIFSVVVMHKIIAMLIYLVHEQRPAARS